ncbi:MAG TPA: hypothetical protein VGM90_12320 [Kofleriaceae bacterium]|jgi:hypothetical protein
MNITRVIVVGALVVGCSSKAPDKQESKTVEPVAQKPAMHDPEPTPDAPVGGPQNERLVIEGTNGKRVELSILCQTDLAWNGFSGVDPARPCRQHGLYDGEQRDEVLFISKTRWEDAWPSPTVSLDADVELHYPLEAAKLKVRITSVRKDDLGFAIKIEPRGALPASIKSFAGTLYVVTDFGALSTLESAPWR